MELIKQFYILPTNGDLLQPPVDILNIVRL